MSASPPRLRQLVRVELRKSTDTRAGRWLLILIAVVAIVGVVLALILSDAKDQTFGDFVYTAQLPMALLLPVLGILSMTGEWSQRTALTTFALVPDRTRVLAAKLLGLASLAAILVAASIVAASIATLIAMVGSGGHWGPVPLIIGRVLLFECLVVFAGAGFGLALLNAPAALVGFFILPSLLTALVSISSALRGPVHWLDFVANVTHLLGDDLTAGTWGKILVSVGTWAVLPFAIGSFRVHRADIT
jgi:ABC-type transport system involved in multi-copper enzyme maturation permease subunit